MTQATELLSGAFRQFLFSPKGGIEGVLLSVNRKTIQVSMSPKDGAVLSRICAAGKRLRVLATRDHSPKTAGSAHPVYEFESLADASGEPIKSSDADAGHETVKGVVAALHFARHGQPNGVVLGNGEFIHLRPDGMTETGLRVGSKVSAVGRPGVTVFNTLWLDAHQVNGIDLR